MCPHETIPHGRVVVSRAAEPARSRVPSTASLRLFGALPDPPTRSLVGELRASGVTVRALYRTAPAPGSAGNGTPLTADDVITGQDQTSRHEWREWLEARDAHVLLAGSPATSLDVMRRAVMLRRCRTVHLWGERPPADQMVTRALRKGWFGPWGLDGIFAGGSRAVDTYRAVTGREVPVHVLPWVTDRGTDIAPQPAVRPTIGYAGPLRTERGVDLLLRALARLPASGRPRLQVAGSGPEATPLRTRASRLGIDRWVDWLGDLDAPALDAARSRWWALIVPTQLPDGRGTAVQTALNSGVPVVASHHVWAATDLVRPGRNGMIVRSSDPDRWAAAVAELTDPAVRAAWSAEARAVGAAFSPKRAAAWLLEVLAAAELARRTGGQRLTSRSFVDDAWSRLIPASHRPDPVIC